MRRMKAIEMFVGLFVLMGLAALMMLAVTVSGLTQIYPQESGYTITADFNNIGGLKPRAKVSIGGVPVGRVKSITLDEDNFVARVTVVIQESFNKIPDDSKANILTAGLLGDNYIGFTPGFSQTNLHEGSHIPVEDTNSALILEQLISRFMANQASSSSPQHKTP